MLQLVVVGLVALPLLVSSALILVLRPRLLSLGLLPGLVLLLLLLLRLLLGLVARLLLAARILVGLLLKVGSWFRSHVINY